MLGMGYAAAKTLTHATIAYVKPGETLEALRRFATARKMSAQEKNIVWAGLLDLYQALLLFRQRRYSQARNLSLGAAKFFDATLLSGKAVLAHLLLARIALELNDLDSAAQEANIALSKLRSSQAPLLVHETQLLLGHIASRRGDESEAYAAYQEARTALETLRTGLQREELKISFVRNRLEVYEALVNLHLCRPNPQVSADEAFAYMEAAKSRSMIEALFQSGQNLPLSIGDSNSAQQIRDLRAELNWYYHRIELEQLRREATSDQRVEELQRGVRSRESQLLQTLRELPVQEREQTSLETPVEFSLNRLQEALPSDTALIEYYSAGDRLIAAVVTQDTIRIEAISHLERVAELLDLLRFQLSKFRMGPIYTQPFREPLLRTTQSHLEDLYLELVKPLRYMLRTKHLVFVPHG